jgi:hypothetical protein
VTDPITRLNAALEGRYRIEREATSVKLGGWWCGALVVVGLLAIAASTTPAVAQEEVEAPAPGQTLYEIRLTDGSVLFARVTEVEGETIVLVTLGGARVEVQRSQIREIRPAEGRVVEGQFWREDPNSSRLFVTATGRTLRQGEAYIGTYLIVLPFLAVGVTDRITLAAGAPVLFGEFEPFYVAPKVQLIRTPAAQVSVGMLAFFFDDESVGITYGVGTFGTPDHAVTLGLGFGFSGDDFSSQPVAMIGGETRTSRRIKLVTENYFLPGETGLIFSAGFRFIGERFSTDVGLAAWAGDGDSFCCVPIINFSYAFGRGR